MTILSDRPSSSDYAAPQAPRQERIGRTVVKWITSTDHKTIGYLYLITATVYFLIAGAMALVIRAELFQPGLQFVDPSLSSTTFQLAFFGLLYPLFAFPTVFSYG